MREIKVYVAGPYTNGDIAVNVRQNIKIGNELALIGYIPFVPLLSHFWHIICPQNCTFWTRLDNAWVSSCDVLLRTSGLSAGADAEVELAKQLGIPVVYSIHELEAKHPLYDEPTV